MRRREYNRLGRFGLSLLDDGDRLRRQGQNERLSVLHAACRQVPLRSLAVEVVKLTSIASVVALPELLYSADMARSVTFNSSPIVLAAAIYLAMLWPVVRLISRLERRIAA